MELKDIKKLINETKTTIKESIVPLVKNRYLALNGGLNPNFEEEEEYKIPVEHTLTFNVDVESLYVEGRYEVEQHEIKTLIVTLDDNLFIIDDEDDEIEWTDLSVEELYFICSYLTRLK